MESFDCCSHYVGCSEKGSCLFIGDDDYKGCYYAKHLRNGRNFYSTHKAENANTVELQKIVEEKKLDMNEKKIISRDRYKDYRIYLECYDRQFNVGRLGGNGWTYPLEADEFEIIHNLFKELQIPFSTEKVDSKCIMIGTLEEPAISRVLFEIDGNESKFSIANYNASFIQQKHANGIKNSLEKRGLKGKIENHNFESSFRHSNSNLEKKKNEVKPAHVVVKGKQLNFTEIAV